MKFKKILYTYSLHKKHMNNCSVVNYTMQSNTNNEKRIISKCQCLPECFLTKMIGYSVKYFLAILYL